MQNIKVAREQYWLTDGDTTTSKVNCYIEPDDQSWIIWCDEDGRPYLYHGQRDESGGVIGDGVKL